MRSIKSIVATILVLGAAFWAYTYFVPAPPLGTGSVSSRPTTLPGTGGNPADKFGPGRGAWVNLYDKSNVLAGRFRVSSFKPQSDGSYDVQDPEAELYQSDGQIVHVHADNGDMRFGTNAPRRFDTGIMGAPDDGTLHDVSVELFPSSEALVSHKPDETLTMPIAEFDNTVHRIYTVPYTDAITKQQVQGDQVPVTVRGTDMDFDGNGMTLYWDDISHELKSLEINHGKVMWIKNVKEAAGDSGAALSGGGKAAEQAPAQVHTRAEADAMFSNNLSAASPKSSDSPNTRFETRPARAASQPGNSPSTRSANQKQSYHATFSDNVHVTQDGKPIADADRMDVVFATQIGVGGKEAATKPTAVSASRQVDASKAVLASDVTAPASQQSRGKSPDTQGLSDTPIKVTWTGPLRVVPAGGANAHLAPKQKIYRFTGMPARVVQNGSTITGDHIVYNSALGTAVATGVPDRPVKIVSIDEVTGKIQGTVFGEAAEFQQANHTAEFTGPGHAEFPDPDEPGSLVRALWSKSCLLNLVDIGKQTLAQHATLQGDAAIVDAPATGPEKLHLSGDAIAIDFENASATAKKKPAADKQKANVETSVAQVVATGTARCLIQEPGSDPKFIESQKLAIHTGKDEQGKPFPRLIVADGDAHASDGEQDLRSGHMDFTLAPKIGSATQESEVSPATQPKNEQAKFELVNLFASENVHGENKDGSQFAGDALRVETKDGQEQVTLIGNPPVVVNGNGGTLHANEIDLRPNDNWALIPGPGVLDAVSETKNGQTPEPVHVSWSGRGLLEGQKNQGDIFGNVEMSSNRRDGSVVVGKADQGHLVLAAKPDTRPADTRPTTRKSNSTPRVQFLKDQQVRIATLLGHASIDSTLLGVSGNVLSEKYITGDRIDSYVLKGEEKLVVPGPGRMLIQDHVHKATKQQADKSSAMGGSGSSAFEWSRQFTFDQNARQANMDSIAGRPVVIIHRPDDANAQPMRMTADKVITDFQPAAPKVGTKAATQPEGDEDAQLVPTKVHAIGHVVVIDKNTTIESSDMVYDPVSKMLTATGRDGDPVRVTDAQHRGGATFRQAILNSETGEIQSLVGLNASGRR